MKLFYKKLFALLTVVLFVLAPILAIQFGSKISSAATGAIIQSTFCYDIDVKDYNCVFNHNVILNDKVLCMTSGMTQDTYGVGPSLGITISMNGNTFDYSPPGSVYVVDDSQSSVSYPLAFDTAAPWSAASSTALNDVLLHYTYNGDGVTAANYCVELNSTATYDMSNRATAFGDSSIAAVSQVVLDPLSFVALVVKGSSKVNTVPSYLSLVANNTGIYNGNGYSNQRINELIYQNDGNIASAATFHFVLNASAYWAEQVVQYQFYLPPVSGLALDCSNSTSTYGGAGSLSIQVTTTKPNDVLILNFFTSGTLGLSVTGSLTWTQHSSLIIPSSGPIARVMYEYNSTLITPGKNTVTITSGVSVFSAIEFCVSGSSTPRSPYDSSLNAYGVACSSACNSLSTAALSTSSTAFIFYYEIFCIHDDTPVPVNLGNYIGISTSCDINNSPQPPQTQDLVSWKIGTLASQVFTFTTSSPDYLGMLWDGLSGSLTPSSSYVNTNITTTTVTSTVTSYYSLVTTEGFSHIVETTTGVGATTAEFHTCNGWNIGGIIGLCGVQLTTLASATITIEQQHIYNYSQLAFAYFPSPGQVGQFNGELQNMNVTDACVVLGVNPNNSTTTIGLAVYLFSFDGNMTLLSDYYFNYQVNQQHQTICFDPNVVIPQNSFMAIAVTSTTGFSIMQAGYPYGGICNSFALPPVYGSFPEYINWTTVAVSPCLSYPLDVYAVKHGPSVFVQDRVVNINVNLGDTSNIISLFLTQQFIEVIIFLVSLPLIITIFFKSTIGTFFGLLIGDILSISIHAIQILPFIIVLIAAIVLLVRGDE